MKKTFACAALALFVAGCDNNGNPTNPSQVNIEFTTTDITVGSGAEARQGSTATVNYALWLYDPNGPESKGRQIPQSGTLPPFVVGAGTLIRGFEQAVLGMRVGGKRRVYVPASMGFGSSGTPDGSIPPNAALVFEIELTALQ